MLLDLGADTGLNLDGGGSTTLVARPLGGTTATLRNTPSDGQERADPTGIGLFVAPGDGKVGSLAVSPEDAARLPGPAPHAQRGRPRRSPGARRRRRRGQRNRRADEPRTTSRSPRTIGDVKQDIKVARPAPAAHARALEQPPLVRRRRGQPDAQGHRPRRRGLHRPDRAAGHDARLRPRPDQGRGDRGRRAEDHAAEGGRHDARRQGRRPASSGSRSRSASSRADVYTFNHADEASRWNVNGTTAANQKLDTDADGNLRLTYKAERNSRHQRQDAASTIAVPGAPLRLHLKLQLDAGAAVLLHLLPRRGQRHARPARHAGQGRRRRLRLHAAGGHEVPDHDHGLAGDRDQRRAAEGRRRHVQEHRRRLLGDRRRARRSSR